MKQTCIHRMWKKSIRALRNMPKVRSTPSCTSPARWSERQQAAARLSAGAESCRAPLLISSAGKMVCSRRRARSRPRRWPCRRLRLPRRRILEYPHHLLLLPPRLTPVSPLQPAVASALQSGNARSAQLQQHLPPGRGRPSRSTWQPAPSPSPCAAAAREPYSGI